MLLALKKVFLLNRYERRGKGAFVANAFKGRRRRRRHHPFSGSSLFRRRRCRDFQRTAEGKEEGKIERKGISSFAGRFIPLLLPLS